jgi:hypothetical protein
MNKDSAFYYYHQELTDDWTMHILNEWQQHKGNEDARQSWKLIPKSLLVSAYKYNAKTGLTRDKQIDKIQDIIIENCVKLNINTVLFGHTQVNPFHAFERYLPDEMTESEFEELLEEFEWFACDDKGNWYISDYAIDKLNDLCIELLAEEDYGKKLYFIDRILNTIHWRSDLPSCFVEGGSHTLTELSAM